MALHDIYIDPVSHDIDFDNFRLTESNGEAIAQKIKIRLLTFLKEWRLNKAAGTPWFERILRKGVTEYVADQEIRRRILDTEGVRAIGTFVSELNVSTRAYECRFTAITDFDEELDITVPLEV